MTVTVPTLPRGFKNWYSDTTQGIRKTLVDLATDVNSIIGGAVSAEDYFSVDTISASTNQTLTTTATYTSVTFTASGKSITMADCTAEATLFDGGRYVFKNDGAEAFAIKDDGGTDIVSIVPPGAIVELVLVDDTTANGTWQVLQDNIIQITEVTASGNVLATYQDKLIEVNSGSAITMTIQPNATIAFDVGTVIPFYRKGAGTVTFAAGGGVTLNSANSRTKLRAQYSSGALIKVASDTWLLVGDIST